MLPNDPDPAAEAGPGSSPMPTGLVDTTILAPVQTPRAQRRRGWPLAASMVLVAVMGGGALFMSGYSGGRDAGKAPASALSDRDAWQPFWDVYDAVTTRYPLGPVERNTLIEGAIRGMVESVGDPYSSYLSPEDFTGTLNDISGTFEGIGAEIGSVDANGYTSDCAKFGPDCHLVIIAPIEGSPAEKAGLKPGDVILMIDGSTLDGLTPDEARDRVRGKAGTEV
ncbi:MAG: S41 family peptidase, partial [Chloroflexota bacterium]